jgi:hypothetical protein
MLLALFAAGGRRREIITTCNNKLHDRTSNTNREYMRCIIISDNTPLLGCALSLTWPESQRETSVVVLQPNAAPCNYERRALQTNLRDDKEDS